MRQFKVHRMTWLAGSTACAALVLGQPAEADFIPPQAGSLQLWLDATTGVFDENDNDVSELVFDETESSWRVHRWEDQSGNDRHVTPTEDGVPTYRNRLNYTPITENDVDHPLPNVPIVDIRSQISGWGPLTGAFDEPLSSDAYTFIAIHHRSLNSSHQSSILLEDEAGDFVLRQNYEAHDDVDRVRMSDQGEYVRTTGDERVDITRYMGIYSGIADGENSKFYHWTELMEESDIRDDVTFAGVDNLQDYQNEEIHGIRLGEFSGGGHGTGIQAVMLWDTVLSDEERIAVEEHLARQFHIPEPGSLALVGLGGLMLLRRRRA